MRRPGGYLRVAEGAEGGAGTAAGLPGLAHATAALGLVSQAGTLVNGFRAIRYCPALGKAGNGLRRGGAPTA